MFCCARLLSSILCYESRNKTAREDKTEMYSVFVETFIQPPGLFIYTMKQTETSSKGVNSDIAVSLGSNYDVNELLILHERAAQLFIFLLQMRGSIAL